MSITIKKLSTRRDDRLLFYRNLNNFDPNCLMEDMCSCSWADIRNCITPDESLAVWSTLYNNVKDKHMPIMQTRGRRSIHVQPEWTNKEIKCNSHKRLHKKTSNFIQDKIWRNQLINLIRSFKFFLSGSHPIK